MGSTSASTAFDLHARPRASLGSLQPSPGPHKPILSTHPLLPPKLFSLIISPPPPAPLDCTPLQSLRPHLQSSTSPPGLVSSHNRSPFSTCFPVAVSVSVVGFEPIVAPQTVLSQRHPHTCRRTSDIWPVHHHSCPPSPFQHPPPNSPRRLLRYRLAGIHLLCSTRPVASTLLILLSTLVPQPNPSPVPAPLRF